MSVERSGSDYPALAKDPVGLEGAVSAYWERAQLFARTQSKAEEQARPHFIFYEGPPTANGHPGVHHVITRLAKDAVP
ncbi:class I tRNA ligase family protein, partial [bacterium]|nr:class I tRNA ligase family protein [bacterium]